MPGAIPDNASQATVTRRAEGIRIAAKVERAERFLRRAIEYGLGPVSRRIELPATGLRTYRTWEIMSMAEELCIPTHEDIAALETKLTAWDYSLTFDTNIANLGDTIYLLNERGHHQSGRLRGGGGRGGATEAAANKDEDHRRSPFSASRTALELLTGARHAPRCKTTPRTRRT